MKKVIIFGTGKAARLHFNKYKMLIEEKNIFFVDCKGKTTFCNRPVYQSLELVLTKEKIDSNNIIADICTPRSEFTRIIETCMSKNVLNIIVEKPFIVSKEYFNNKEKLKIIMVNNYSYSCIIKKAKTILGKLDLKIEKIYTNFSKNRIKDSSKMRGMTLEKVTSVFEIEMPHQIYMADYFTNESNFDIYELKTKDMIIGETCLKKHGYGLVKMKKGDVEVIHESDLMHNSTVRKVEIYLEQNHKIVCNFFVYDNEFNIIVPGSVSLYNGTILKEKTEYKEDDNILEFLRFAYNCLNKGNDEKVFNNYKKFIIDFSNEINTMINW